MQVAPLPERSRLRVLVGRRFFRPGDGYSGRRRVVLVATGRCPPREASSPSRWSSWSTRIGLRVVHRIPNRHLHQNVEMVREGLLRGTPHPETRREAAGLAHARCSMDSRRHATHPRLSVHKPEIECGCPVLHVAPPSVGSTGAPRRWVSVEVSGNQCRIGAQASHASREPVQEGGVLRPVDVGQHVYCHHDWVVSFRGREAPSPLDHRAGRASRAPVPEYGNRAD